MARLLCATGSHESTVGRDSGLANMIRVLGAVAAAYVGYSLGNVVKHPRDDRAPRPGYEILPEDSLCDEDVCVDTPKASTEDSLRGTYLADLENDLRTDHNVSLHCNADDGDVPSPGRAAAKDRSDIADKLDGGHCSLFSVEEPNDLEYGLPSQENHFRGRKAQVYSAEDFPASSISLEVSSTTASSDKLSNVGECLAGPADQYLQDQAPVATCALTQSNGEVPSGSQHVDTRKRVPESANTSDEDSVLLETAIASGRQGTIVSHSTPEFLDGGSSDCLESRGVQKPQEDGKVRAETDDSQNPADCPQPRCEGLVARFELETSEHRDAELVKQMHYLEMFQQEWTHLLHEERRLQLLLLEASRRAKFAKHVYTKAFEMEWIQRLEEERAEQNCRAFRDQQKVESDQRRRMDALFLLRADNTKLQDQLAETVRAKEQHQAVADGKIHDLHVMLSNLEAENKLQREMIHQSINNIQEAIQQEKASSEEKLKDLCLLLAKVEAENLSLKDLVSKHDGRIQDAIVQAGQEASAELANLNLELEQVKADHASQQGELIDLKAKLQESELEKAEIDTQLRESFRQAENQKRTMEAQLQSRLAEERKVQLSQLQEQMRLQLEEHKVEQQRACQKQLDEDKTNLKLELQAQWSVKIKAHKEEITSFLVEETKKKLIDEREKWRSAQEIEWRKRLDKEREQQLLLQEEKDKERKLADDRLRKEGARLELRLSSVSAKEREIELQKDALQQKEREIGKKLLEVEMLQTKNKLREKILKASENDFFDESNFDRWISLRLGKRGETVFWYSTGELYDYPTGDVLAKVEGLEVTRSIVVGRYQVHQVSRKVYLFRDKDNNELLTEYHGGPVMPVTYKYQKIAYTLKGNVLVTEAANGKGDQLAPLRGNLVSLRHLTNSSLLAFTCPVFVNVQTARGAYQSYENYEYFMDKAEVDLNNHCSMVRFGSTPPFAESAVMHMTGWRLDSFDLLPESIQQYIRAENPTWTEAPPD